MKVLNLSTQDLRGGAPRAAYRLHHGLLAAAVDSKMLVQNGTSDEAAIIYPQTKLAKAWNYLRPTLDQLPVMLYRQRDAGEYSPQWLPSKIDSQIKALAPEIINLHWVCSGYLPIEAIAKFSSPLVWTLHDMWAFTGGCHYTQDCDRYQQACGQCPILKSKQDWDLSRWIWQRKAKAWQEKEINLTIVTPSKWLADCAAKSSLCQNFPIRVIPNGLDHHRYQAIDKQLAKKILGLPLDKQVILFGSIKSTSDRRKGFYLLEAALQKLKQYSLSNRIELVIFGASPDSNAPNFGFRVHYFGQLNDDIAIALLYAAADIFVAPSVQDNLPNTVMEALSCGTPCAAFNLGGIPDMIEHYSNGYLADPYEVEDLARGIAWILENPERYQSLALAARVKVEQEFTLKKQAESYIDLYREILADANVREF